MIDVVIQDIIQGLSNSNAPVIASYYDSSKTKIIVIGLKKGVVLKKHKAPSKAQLLIIKGDVTFETATSATSLKTYDTFEVPLDVEHEVLGDTDAVFLLILTK